MKITRTLLIASIVALAPMKSFANDTEIATFAGGCFWCVESDFDNVPGVLDTLSGYIGGSSDNPTYKNHMRNGHREAVQITYDPAKVSFERLLHIFWRSVDPTDAQGQFCDRGHSYTTAIYANNEQQQQLALDSRQSLIDEKIIDAEIVTPVENATQFWPAEDYHQDYYLKNPIRYKFYRTSCGRDKRVSAIWGEMARDGIADH
jgi:peptide-methionine (S)-S-oxide reductase